MVYENLPEVLVMAWKQGARQMEKSSTHSLICFASHFGNVLWHSLACGKS